MNAQLAESKVPAPSVQGVVGKYEVEFKLGNLTAAELQVCASLKALLCDPRFEKLRQRLNSGGGLQISAAGALQIFALEFQFGPNPNLARN